MVLMMVERVTPSLRGELTRWLLQPRSGVFVGRVSAMLRDRLWDRVVRQKRTGAAMLIYTTNSEQGFAFRTAGDTTRLIVDFDGLQLVKTRSTG